MTVESNDAIAIATLSDWLKNIAPVYQPVATCTRNFSRALSGVTSSIHAVTLGNGKSLPFTANDLNVKTLSPNFPGASLN